MTWLNLFLPGQLTTVPFAAFSATVLAVIVEALGHLGAPEADSAVDALERAAGDTDPTVRLAAVSALGQLGGGADEALGRLAGGADTLTAQVATRLLAGRVQA